MQCPSCGVSNLDGMKFCGTCGTSLQQPCPNCGSYNPPQFNFCGNCGRPLPFAQTASPPDSALPARAPALAAPGNAERRQLTVMFCDLVGSTALSLELDPEELREVIRAYQETTVAVIAEYAGYTAQYLGDGVLAYFGYPAALEQEAERAVRAGLQILEDIDRLNQTLQEQYDVEIGVRISLHTGIVVIGQMGGGDRHEHLALGTTPNVAARLQALAEPGTLIISSSTHKLLQDAFLYEDLGLHQLKGVSSPVNVYRVLAGREHAAPASEDGSEQQLLLIGRRSELDLLTDRWQEALAGGGQAVLIAGEPGIGKSNLTRSLQARLKPSAHTELICRCEPHGQNTAFYPILYMLQRALNFYPGQPVPERLDILEFMLERNGISKQEAVPLLAGLMAIPVGERYQTVDTRSQNVRDATQQILLKLLLQAPEEQPVLLILEDLHWADPSSLELIGRLLEQLPDHRLLALLTHRPTFQPPWAARSCMAQVTLNRLSPREASKLIRSVTQSKDLPENVREEIVRKTDGVPLFVEELTKMVLESGLLRSDGDRYVLTAPLPPLAIPASLQDSLMARLDRLSPVKELAQLGAAIGREFGYELIQAVSSMPDLALQDGLAQLVGAELLYQQGRPPKATYVFKHALIQDVAYESLLRSRRQQYHQQIANVLEASFPDVCMLQPELLAQHYTAAGLHQEAVPYWLRSGEHAAEKSAYAEAAHHFKQGLQALSMLEMTPERKQQRLMLLTGLGTAQSALRGYTDRGAKETFEAARALIEPEESSPYATSVLAGLFAWHFVRGDLHHAEQFASELLQHAQDTANPMAVVGGNLAMGATLHTLGRLAEARAYLEEGLRYYKPGERLMVAFVGQDLGVATLAYLAHTLWALGYPLQAKARMQEAIDIARRLNHPHSLAFSLFFAGSLHYQLRDPEAAAFARELLQLSEAYGFRHWRLEGLLMEGWILLNDGRTDEARAHLDRVLAEHHEAFMGDDLPNYHPFLAESYLQLGMRESALEYLRKSLHRTAFEGDTLWTAEMWRLTGETLLLDPADPHEAETYFQRAIDLARRQGARALELRALLSLAKLWTPDHRANGRNLLQEALTGLTEDADTAEMREARRLAHVLSDVNDALPPAA